MGTQTLKLRGSQSSRWPRWLMPSREVVVRQLEAPAVLMPLLFVGAMLIGYAACEIALG